ncbi:MULTISPECIES: ATP/GTP-binding protein [unclassified Thiocapsa]|uniref:ATP/GTP-binding protein n=1 Tax=unclassified Thiocapsa TaxID=2641286 RepID=UPI0035AF86BE
MYDSLKILRFRAFDAFEIHHLSRVNLIVGKNNAGKTSLLDAVEMMALGGRVVSLLRSPRRRGEISLAPADEKMRRVLNIRHIFWGHQIQAGTCFEITGIADSQEIKVSCEVRLGQSDQTQFGQLSEQAELETPLEIIMTGPDNPDGEPILPVSASGSLLEFARSRLSSGPTGGLATVWFLGTEFGAHPTSLRQSWEQLVLTPEEDMAISAMKMIEPAIERLVFISSATMAESTPVVKLTGVEGRIPLGTLGDGIKRLLAQAIYMARAAGGVLLIDEIDTGLHYTTLESMWRFVIESARRLDVQVFATSHSGDCIRALAWLQTDAPDLAADISVHRIDRAAPAAVRYSAADIEIAARHHIEVRG